MSKAVKPKVKNKGVKLSDSDLDPKIKDQIREILAKRGLKPEEAENVEVFIPVFEDPKPDCADLGEGERDYLAQAEDLVNGAIGGIPVGDGDGIQVFDGNPDAEKLEDFSTDTPEELRNLVKYIESNSLQDERPWSNVYNVYRMLVEYGREHNHG